MKLGSSAWLSLYARCKFFNVTQQVIVKYDLGLALRKPEPCSFLEGHVQYVFCDGTLHRWLSELEDDVHP